MSPGPAKALLLTESALTKFLGKEKNRTCLTASILPHGHFAPFFLKMVEILPQLFICVFLWYKGFNGCKMV